MIDSLRHHQHESRSIHVSTVIIKCRWPNSSKFTICQKVPEYAHTPSCWKFYTPIIYLPSVLSENCFIALFFTYQNWLFISELLVDGWYFWVWIIQNVCFHEILFRDTLLIIWYDDNLIVSLWDLVMSLHAMFTRKVSNRQNLDYTVNMIIYVSPRDQFLNS